MSDDLRNRALGAMLGQLAGDALGSMVEFQSPEDLARRYPGGLRTIGPSPVFGTMAGQATDDSELCFSLADALLAHPEGRYAFRLAAGAYVDWYRSGPFDVGNTIGDALRGAEAAWARRTDVVVALFERANFGSLANGALMRHSVLGIWGAGQPLWLVAAAARADCQLTHPHPICKESSAAYVVALAQVIQNGLDGVQAWEGAVEWQRKRGREPRVLACLEEARHTPPAAYGGLVLNALQNAFYRAIHAPSIEDGVVDTVMQGHDTDTNACIAGALLGAIHGAGGIPVQWSQAVLSCSPGPGTPCPRPSRYAPSRATELVDGLLDLRRRRRPNPEAGMAPPPTSPPAPGP